MRTDTYDLIVDAFSRAPDLASWMIFSVIDRGEILAEVAQNLMASSTLQLSERTALTFQISVEVEVLSSVSGVLSGCRGSDFAVVDRELLSLRINRAIETMSSAIETLKAAPVLH